MYFYDTFNGWRMRLSVAATIVAAIAAAIAAAAEHRSAPGPGVPMRQCQFTAIAPLLMVGDAIEKAIS